MTLKILPFAPALAAEFDAINRAWIEDAFVIEPHDEEVLSDPQTHIISPGGPYCSSPTTAARSLARAR